MVMASTLQHPLPPPQLSIFNLPHILQEIAYWILCPKDLATCVRVNKTWHDAITPVLWHYFFFLNQSHIQTSAALRLAISRNARHPPTFSSLGRVASRTHPVLPKAASIWKIQEFITTQFPFDNEGQIRSLGSAQKLWLSSPQAQYRPEGLVALFQSCITKRQLEDMFIGVHFHDVQDFHERMQRDVTFRNLMSLDQTTLDAIYSQQQHSNTLTLKKLALVGDMLDFEDSILFPILRLCPTLEDLTLSSYYFTDEQVAHLLDVGIKGTLERISLSGGIDTTTGRRSMDMSELGTQRALMGHAATLVELLIVTPVVRTYPDEEITGYLPLTSMGRLRRALTGLGAMDIIQGEPWTCTDLRVLQLVIRNVPRSETRAPVITGEPLSPAADMPKDWIPRTTGGVNIRLNGGYVDILEPTVLVNPIQYQCLELSLDTGTGSSEGAPRASGNQYGPHNGC
ncbi:hypothetical protein BGZ82_010470 [Podila clonocystis]|nr:hypothetical protein BGZ82_010470 [Podila clonocystis]